MKNESKKTGNLMICVLLCVIAAGCTAPRTINACPVINLSIESKLTREDANTIDSYNSTVAKQD